MESQASIAVQGTRTLDRITFTDEQINLIRSQIAPNAKPDELALFLYQCKRTGLDPLARQMYCIHRGGKMTIQTSIDGFRVVAERSGDYAGQDMPNFLEQDGKLIACSITVYRFRGNQRYPAAVGVAYMSEYNAGGPMWQKMPHTMLAKCAEAQALRKAYPQDLSGLYTGDEMEQADTHTVPHEPVEFTPAIDVQAAVRAACAKLSACKTPDELSMLKSTLPDFVVSDPQFKEAGKMRYAEIMKDKERETVNA